MPTVRPRPRAGEAKAPAVEQDRLVESIAAPDLGEAVKVARLERGMTLSALASQTGLSASALSQIERGAMNPSIVSLRRIAAALERPVFSFLGAEPAAPQVVVRADGRRTLRLPGSPVVYQLLSPNLRGRLEVLYYEVEVGGVTFEGGMAHAGEECVVMLEGRARLEVGADVHDLAEGDSATFSSAQPHALRNIGSVPVRAISCITPPHF